MSFRKYLLGFQPVHFIPFDSVTPDGLVEDIVTFDFSQESDAVVVQASGTRSDDYSLGITEPIVFGYNAAAYSTFMMLVSLPADFAGGLITFNNLSVSAAARVITVGAQSSPAIGPGWHLVMYDGAWTITQVDDTDSDTPLVQNLVLLPALLAADKTDIAHAALNGFVFRSAASDNITIIPGDMNVLSADWHIVSV